MVRLGALKIVVLLVVILGASAAHAGYKEVIGGVTVSYSNDGAEAFFDPADGTLTIAISESGGSLSIKGPKVCETWIDIYLLAGGAQLRSISVKGTPDCEAYIAGYVDYAEKLSLTSTYVGDLFCYPGWFGLYSSSSDELNPRSISIKNGSAQGPVLGSPEPPPANLCQ